MAIRIIPATSPELSASNITSDAIPPEKRVAAYCRVSTNLEEQESSYEAQCTHYTHYINDHPGWTLAKIYADEGISGTNISKRSEFLQMISDCEDGKIDMVITKSISRFARNTLDCLKYIRKLKALDIPIYFEKEAINTLDAKGEVLITIMASIAQQESQSISQNVRMGIQYRFAQGKVMVNHNQFLGYTKNDAGDLVIVPEEAVIIRRIYREFLQGLSPLHIAKGLEQDHIKTGPGKNKWYESTVRSILRNEKYMGDLILQKYYTVDFMTKKIAKNTGQLPQYYVENAHEPIIPKSVFLQVQGEFQRRTDNIKASGQLIHYGSKMALGGRLICCECGSCYRRYAKKDPSRTDWRCQKRRRSAEGCSGRNIKETEAKQAVLRALNLLPAERENLIRLQERILWGPIAMIDEQLARIEKKIPMINARIEKEEDQKKKKLYVKLLRGIQEKKNQLIVERSQYAWHEVQIRTFLELIDGMTDSALISEKAETFSPACYDYADFFERTKSCITPGPIKVFDDNQIITYVENIDVLPDGYQVNFKAGVSIKVEGEK